MTAGEVSWDVLHTYTFNGWMDMDLFEHWLTLHFLRYAPPARRLSLLMDGHSTHFIASPAAICLATEQEVISRHNACYTEAIIIDKGVFGPVEEYLSRVCT